VGYTTEEFRERTGLPSGIPVVSAGGDQQCAALGAGIYQEGSIQITTGTGSFVMASSYQLRLDPQMKVLCSVAAVPGQYLLESSILTTSALYSWVASTLYERTNDKAASMCRLNEDAASAPVGSNGVIMLPYFQGRGSPDWNAEASGFFSNITLATTRGDMVRSVLEGIAAEIAENVDLMIQLVGKVDKILISGGLTNLPLFNQIQADMFDRELTVPANKETTSLGAWISASIALGIHASYANAYDASAADATPMLYSPVQSNVGIYQTLRANKSYLYNSLNDAGIYERFRDFQAQMVRN
jgi:xylulokinase/glycerol kinase